MGDSVLLSSNGINWPVFSESPSSSIPEYLGPFTVTAVDSALDNITLALPTFITSKRVHPTFHVSKLKPFHSRTTVLPQLPDLFARTAPIGYTDNGEELFAIDRILQKRIRHGHPEYQVHYTCYPSTHLQWEPLTPQNRHTWESDWSLLQSFDPSLGPFSPTSIPLRRSTRSSPSHTPPSHFSLLSTIIT